MNVKEMRKILNGLSDDMEIRFLQDSCGSSISSIDDWWIEDGELILG